MPLFCLCGTPGFDDDLSQPVEMSLGRQRPIGIPASLRQALRIKQGDALVARLGAGPAGAGEAEANQAVAEGAVR
jgi:hypothetical protein